MNPSQLAEVALLHKQKVTTHPKQPFNLQALQILICLAEKCITLPLGANASEGRQESRVNQSLTEYAYMGKGALNYYQLWVKLSKSASVHYSKSYESAEP